MFDMGLAYSFSVIAIPALTGKDPKNNPDEFLHITDDEVSWLGRTIWVCFTAFDCHNDRIEFIFDRR